MGIQLRVTWEDKDGQFKSVNIFLELLKCDPSKPDKTAEATAEKLLAFIHGEMNLKEYDDFLTFTSDYAIYGSIIKAMNKLGSDLKLIYTVKRFGSKSDILEPNIFNRLIIFSNLKGFVGLENKWVVCSTHDVMNVFKLADKNLWENYLQNDGKSK